MKTLEERRKEFIKKFSVYLGVVDAWNNPKKPVLMKMWKWIIKNFKLR